MHSLAQRGQKSTNWFDIGFLDRDFCVGLELEEKSLALDLGLKCGQLAKEPGERLRLNLALDLGSEICKLGFLVLDLRL